MTARRELLTLGRYLRREFGVPVRKLSLDAGFTCPNRDGTRGSGGCAFCANESFTPGEAREHLPIAEQARRQIDRLQAHRKPVRHYLAYFQAYTNTYAPPEQLRHLYDEALAVDGVVGLDISTRPDCVGDDVAELLEHVAGRTHLWVELGLQSSHDATLRAINRGHTFADFAAAVRRLSGRGLRLVVHLIVGLPGETREMVRRTAQRTGELLAGFDGPAVGVKLHHLHVVRGTALAAQHARQPLRLLDSETYVEWACDCLERLPPETVIHRFVGDAMPGTAIAPDWEIPKSEMLRRIETTLARRHGAGAPVRAWS